MKKKLKANIFIKTNLQNVSVNVSAIDLVNNVYLTIYHINYKIANLLKIIMITIFLNLRNK